MTNREAFKRAKSVEGDMITANSAKGASYKLALEQITKSIKSRCYLEAIAIEESLIADRLWSTLNVKRPSMKRVPTLGDGLEKWHPTKSDKNGNPIPPHKNAELLSGEMEFIYPSLCYWWSRRCVLLHGIVKASSGKSPEVPASDFLKEAEATARFGLRVFRFMDNWVKCQIRAERTVGRNGKRK